MDALGEVNARTTPRHQVASVQPAHLRPVPFRRRHQKIAQGDHRLVRAPGQGNAAELPRVCLVRELPGARRQGAFVREDGHAGARGQRRPRQALGHQQDLGVQRSWPSTAWTTGTPGRSPSSAWGRARRNDNASARRRAAQWLDDGAVFAFGLSEREHGADITPPICANPDGGDGFEPRAASTTSVTPTWPGSRCSAGGRTWTAQLGMCSSRRTASTRNYRLVKNIVQAQMFVAEFRLENYPVRPQDAAHRTSGLRCRVEHSERRQVQHRAGLHRHASMPLYEAVTHAHNRILYGNRVTDFPHTGGPLWTHAALG